MKLVHPLPQSVIDSFHAMWDNFPEPVSLVHESREVIAVNKLHHHEPGVCCARTGRNGPHAACRANLALKTREAVILTAHSATEGKEQIIYWIPLDEHPDYFIHLSVRIKIDYDNKTFAMSPIEEEHRKAMAYRWESADSVDIV
jgi:hypothetical protein